jgi:hypothetical protein
MERGVGQQLSTQYHEWRGGIYADSNLRVSSLS